MVKMYCDRCGEEIVGQYSWLKRKEYYTTAQMEIIPRRDPNGVCLRTPTDEKILCSRCTLSYYNWYNHPNNDGKEEK